MSSRLGGAELALVADHGVIVVMSSFSVPHINAVVFDVIGTLVDLTELSRLVSASAQ